MAIKSDFHLHTNFSGDSQTPMEEMILRGIELGLETMCFTEHHDEGFPYTHGETTEVFSLNADSYLYDFIRYKEKYQDKIKLLFGVELGIQADLVRNHLLFSKAHEYDFIIASSHLCHGKDPYYQEFYENRTEKEAYTEYFTSILENIKVFKNFDVYGHLDYVVRYGPNRNKNYSYREYADILDAILKQLIENEKGIEVNTGGLKYGLGDTNPCTDILKRYRELGGEILTIGSDAHTPEYIGYAFDKTCELLKSCGFSYYTIFENRLPEYKKL